MSDRMIDWLERKITKARGKIEQFNKQLESLPPNDPKVKKILKNIRYHKREIKKSETALYMFEHIDELEKEILK